MNTATKKTTSMKLDKIEKDEAKKIFKQLGLTMGEAFNIFLHQVNLVKGIPFSITIPNETTRKVIEEARQGINVDDFKKA
jgi:DNA-damage-inducible protein J